MRNHDTEQAESATRTIETPLGPIRLLAHEGALIGAYLPSQPPIEGGDRDDPILDRAARELAEYFAGRRRAFDVPLRPRGTPFQAAVWRALGAIPFGATRSYGDLARALGTAPRAIGSANAKNPLSIFVPCHRVIGASGALVGYAGGEHAKRWLLDHEACS